MPRLLIGLLVGLLCSVSYAQIRDASGNLVTPQLTGSASDVLKGDGSFGAASGGAGLPTGFVGLVTSGTCPTGTSEVAALNGKTLFGTLAANGDVGAAVGADTITPAGTNSGGAVSAHAGAAVADHASHTHTYTDVIAHTHTVTSQTATTGSATSYEHGVLDTSSAEAEATEVTGSTGVATGTTAGPSATLTHSVTQPSAHTFTQPTFTGNQFDNRSAGIKVIFCSAN